MEENQSKKEALIVASKVRNYIKESGCIVAAESVDAINEKLYAILDQAIARTKENKRTTLRPHDL